MKTRPMALALLVAGLLLAGSVNTAAASPAGDAARADIQATFGFVPAFLKAVPDVALPGAWAEMKSLQMNPATALSGKDKELIGIAVSAQIPCTYCIHAHTEFAKLNGATEEEIKEAVVMGGLTRHWSTFVNGIQVDMAKFREEIQQALAHAKKGGAAPVPGEVVDAATALKDAQQWFGATPSFLAQFPPEGVAGAWTAWRDVEMSETALSPKLKSLMSLAVASQVPCTYCVYADTEFAKLGGATDRELREAVAMASLTRFWSTWLNGSMADYAVFKKDIARLVKGVQKEMAAAKKTTERRALADDPGPAREPVAPKPGTTGGR